jgi:hypothetical protein
MTAQVNDVVRYHGEEYDLIGVGPDEAFKPSEHGFAPRPWHTANYAGYQIIYTIRKDNRLRLGRLTVLDRFGLAPELGSTKPRIVETRGLTFDRERDIDAGGASWMLDYSGMRMALDFTGTMLVAKDFEQKRYQHMGYQAASAYYTVLELTFNHGRLTQAVDRSAEIGAGVAPPDEPGDNVVGWIAHRFRREL